MEKYEESNIYRIALTGGPKAGKTSVKETIKKAFEGQGYKVLLVGETATEVINAGLEPPKRPKTDDPEEWKEYFKKNIDFQEQIMALQISKEMCWYEQAKRLGGKVLLVYDRAIADNYGYLKKLLRDIEIYRKVFHIEGEIDLYKELLSKYGLTIEKVMEFYDGVISLETCVKYIDFKTQPVTDTTKRLEDDAKEAILVDELVSEGWKSHPNYIRIQATEKFEDKEEQIIEAITMLLEKRKVRKLQ